MNRMNISKLSSKLETVRPQNLFEAYSETYQISKMENFSKFVGNYFRKRLNVRCLTGF